MKWSKVTKKNSNKFLLGRNEIMQQIRAEKNQCAIEELTLKTMRLKNKNEKIKTFQTELQGKIDQF